MRQEFLKVENLSNCHCYQCKVGCQYQVAFQYPVTCHTRLFANARFKTYVRLHTMDALPTKLMKPANVILPTWQLTVQRSLMAANLQHMFNYRQWKSYSWPQKKLWCGETSYGEMYPCWNVHVVKCPCGEKSVWWNVSVVKCLCVKMSVVNCLCLNVHVVKSPATEALAFEKSIWR